MRRRFINITIFALIAGLVYLSWDNIVVKPPLYLGGTYQSERSLDNFSLIMLSFFQDGTYEEYYNAILTDSGTYHQEKEQVYTLQSNYKDDYVVLLEGDSFYYYFKNDKGNDIFYLKNLDKVPTRILTESEE